MEGGPQVPHYGMIFYLVYGLGVWKNDREVKKKVSDFGNGPLKIEWPLNMAPLNSTVSTTFTDTEVNNCFST